MSRNHKVVNLQMGKEDLICLVLTKEMIDQLIHNNKEEVMITIQENSQMG